MCFLFVRVGHVPSQVWSQLKQQHLWMYVYWFVRVFLCSCSQSSVVAAKAAARSPFSIFTFSQLNSKCDFLCELHRSETWDVICGVRCARPGYVVWLCTKTLSYWNTVGICHAQHSLRWNQVMFCRLLVFFAASLAASGYVWCYRRYVCLSLCLTVFAAKSAVPLNVRMLLCRSLLSPCMPVYVQVDFCRS